MHFCFRNVITDLFFKGSDYLCVTLWAFFVPVTFCTAVPQWAESVVYLKFSVQWDLSIPSLTWTLFQGVNLSILVNIASNCIRYFHAGGIWLVYVSSSVGLFFSWIKVQYPKDSTFNGATGTAFQSHIIETTCAIWFEAEGNRNKSWNCGQHCTLQNLRIPSRWST